MFTHTAVANENAGNIRCESDSDNPSDADCDLDYIETLASDGCFDPECVKEVVSEITIRRTQRSLRDDNKNRKFSKAVLDT